MSDAAPQAAKPQVVRSHRAMDTAFTITIQSDDAAPVQTSVSAGSAPANSKPHTTAANWIFGQNRMGVISPWG